MNPVAKDATLISPSYPTFISPSLSQSPSLSLSLRFSLPSPLSLFFSHPFRDADTERMHSTEGIDRCHSNYSTLTTPDQKMKLVSTKLSCLRVKPAAPSRRQNYWMNLAAQTIVLVHSAGRMVVSELTQPLQSSTRLKYLSSGRARYDWVQYT